MWRSRANAILRSSRRFLAPDKVLISQTLTQTPHPQSSRWVFPNQVAFAVLRFYSEFNARVMQSGQEGGFGDEEDQKIGSFFAESGSGGEEPKASWGSDERRESEDALAAIFEVEKEAFEEAVEKDGMVGDDDGGFGEEAFDGQDMGGDQKVDDVKLREVLEVIQSTEVGRLEDGLNDVDFTLSDEFMIEVLQSVEVCGEKLIGFVRWAASKSNMVKNSGVIDLLVQEVCASNRKYGPHESSALWEYVKEVGGADKRLLNTETLNQLIAGTSKLGRRRAVMEIFNKFEDFGCARDADTYYWTILALGKKSWADTAWVVCEKMLASKSFPENEKVGKIIEFFCIGGKAREAHVVYMRAKENEKCPPVPFLGCLAYHLASKDDTVVKALELLEEYFEDPQTHASWPFGSIIHGLCRISEIEKAEELLNRMLEASLSPGKTVFNFVITALSKARKLEEAVSHLRLMNSIGLTPDIRAYNVIMSGFAKDGRMDEARSIFLEAKKVHSKLGRVSYHILTQGYNRIEEFDNALKCMNEMKEEGIQPNVDEYRKMVQALCLKAIDWRSAEKLVEEMGQRGMRLDGHTCGLIASVKELEEEEMRSAAKLAAS